MSFVDFLVDISFVRFRSESFFLRSSRPSSTTIKGEGPNRSIAPARLPTHIFDCSANMPKFIPWPSSSPSDYYIAWTMPATSTTAKALLLPFRLVGDEFTRSGHCAQSNSILLRLRCNSSYGRTVTKFCKYSTSIATSDGERKCESWGDPRERGEPWISPLCW